MITLLEQPEEQTEIFPFYFVRGGKDTIFFRVNIMRSLRIILINRLMINKKTEWRFVMSGSRLHLINILSSISGDNARGF